MTKALPFLEFKILCKEKAFLSFLDGSTKESREDIEKSKWAVRKAKAIMWLFKFSHSWNCICYGISFTYPRFKLVETYKEDIRSVKSCSSYLRWTCKNMYKLRDRDIISCYLEILNLWFTARHNFSTQFISYGIRLKQCTGSPSLDEKTWYETMRAKLLNEPEEFSVILSEHIISYNLTSFQSISYN